MIPAAAGAPPERRLILKGYLFAFASVMLFALEASLAKLIGPEINPAQVPALRAFLQFAILAVLVRGRLGEAMRTERVGGHVWRGFLSALGAVAYFFVFAHMPLGAATVIFFTSVLFTTALAGPVLAERVGWRRWSATLVGFAGILLVVRPGAIPFDFVLVVAFLLALNAAAINLSTKGLTRTEGTVTIMIWIAATSLVVLVPWSALTWTWPMPRVAALTVLIAMIGMSGQYASITAYRHADASGLAPVFYTRIVLSGLIGWWIFGERIDAMGFAGALLITGSAAYITMRESRVRERERPGAAS